MAELGEDLEQQEPQGDEQPPVNRRVPSRAVRLLLLLLAIVAVGVSFKILLDGASNASADPAPVKARSPYQFTAGSPAPDFTLQTLKGETVSLKDYRGEVLLINFWATWCPPCRSEMPDMEDLYIERKNQDFTVLAINIQEADKPVSSFVDRYGLTFPVLMDVTGEVSQQFGVQSLPTSFFVDKEGRIAGFSMGAMNKSAMLKKLQRVPE